MKIKNSGSYTATVKRNHSLTLMPAIDYLMSQLNLAPTAIDRFVVAEGPDHTLAYV